MAADEMNNDQRPLWQRIADWDFVLQAGFIAAVILIGGVFVALESCGS